MTWLEFSEETRPRIAESVSRECALLAEQYGDIPGAAPYAEMLREYTLRGKLLRGVFVRLAAQTLGGADEAHILSAAAALELAQSAFLIHDDIMDGDSLRRGKPSLHTLIGQNAAICLGDLALLRAFHILSFNAGLGRIFSRHLGATALGQASEIALAKKNAEPTLEEIFAVIQNKTARYTFVLPFEAGAALAGLSEDPSLKELGLRMGLIFQIRDDELNLLASAQTGKTEGGDIRENKKTVCRALLLQKAPEAASLFGREGTLAEVREAYLKHAAGETAGLLKGQEAKAEALLDALPLKKEARSLWGGLLCFLMDRAY